MNNHNSEKVHVHFEIVAEFGFGEDLYVLGPHTCLGSNHIDRALQLHLVLGSRGTLVWKNQATITVARKLEFLKFKLLRFSAGVMVGEETDVGERSIKLSEDEGGHIFLRLDWGKQVHKGSYGTLPTVSSFSNLEHFMGEADRSSVQTAPEITSKERVILVMHQLPIIVEQDPKTEEWEVRWDDENFLSKTHIDKHVRAKYMPRVQSQTFKFGRTSSQSISAHRFPEKPSVAVQDDESNEGTLPQLHWFGVVPSPNPIPKRERPKIAQKLKEFNCTPLWLEPKDVENYDTRYTKQTLWPIMHQQMDIYGDVPTRWWDGFGLEESWNSYVNVNLKFASEVKHMVSTDSNCIVWVHGLHLLLFPLFLKRRLRTVNVGLFLHNPFPSSEIFRSLSVREKLLRAMLNADHIGFHLYEYARHFITCCTRILNLSSETKKGGYLAIKTDGREVLVTCSHVGIEGDFIKTRLEHANIPATIEQLQKKFEGKTVIVGVDGLERLKGLPLKFHAYKRFLEKNPALVGKVVLFQLGIPDVARGTDFERTRAEVASIIAEIDEKFPGSIEYQERLASSWGFRRAMIGTDSKAAPLQDRLPVWGIGHVLMVSSIREGLNLNPFEYIWTREHNGEGKKSGSVMILSQFSGCSRVFSGALRVNPWKIEEVADAILAAVKMTPAERTRRHQYDLAQAKTHGIRRWASALLQDIRRARLDDSAIYESCGFLLNQRLVKLNADFSRLDVEEVLRQYALARFRLCVLDLGGTLIEEGDRRFGAGTAESLPKVRNVLQQLCSDTVNIVFVVSGRTKEDMEELFPVSTFPALGLAAEHGIWIRWPKVEQGTPAAQHLSQEPSTENFSTYYQQASMRSSKSMPAIAGNSTPKIRKGLSRTDLCDMNFSHTSGVAPSNKEWLCYLKHTEVGWKDYSRGLMEVFKKRTNKSTMEEKSNSMVWKYKNTDPEFGNWQAKQLKESLTETLKNFQVDIIKGEHYIEVRPSGLGKDAAVRKILRRLTKVPDFTLCIGDDESDELMFNELKRAKAATEHIGGDIPLPAVDVVHESSRFETSGSSSMHNLLGSSGRNPVIGRPKEETQGLFTCTVGLKPSSASSHLDDVAAVQDLLERITQRMGWQNQNEGYSGLTSLQEEFLQNDDDFFCGDVISDDQSDGTDTVMGPPETVGEYLDQLVDTPFLF